jgi:hypothetical protein
LHAIALAEVVSSLEDSREPVIRLAAVKSSYEQRLRQLGVHSHVHSTRLKERLLHALPSLTAVEQGRDVLLTLNLGDALFEACTASDDTALHMMRTAKAIRKEMFDTCTTYEFDGSFDGSCQKDSVPPSLLNLMNMLLDGSTSGSAENAALSISQLIAYNATRHPRKQPSSPRHAKERETPLPIYVALKIYGTVRSKTLIERLHELGICISYSRLMDINNQLGAAVCQRFQEVGSVCPPNLTNGVFTTAAVDNIDQNPSSATAMDAFHGTAISLMQHPSAQEAEAQQKYPPIRLSEAVTNTASSLPLAYSEVPPLAMSKKEFTAPPLSHHPHVTSSAQQCMEPTECEWLVKVNASLQGTKELQWISWAAYNASIEKHWSAPPSEVALLPLFYESAHSAAMIGHAIDVVTDSVQHVNPGQVPVLAADQPLFAIGKQLQWTFPEKYGEDKLVIMFGGLHIEMAILKVSIFFKHCMTFKVLPYSFAGAW